MQHKKANGERISGRIPYGYDLDENGITLTENTDEQNVITDIYTMRVKGMKLKQIATELSKQSIPTKTGNTHWGHQAIAKILSRNQHNKAS